MTTEAWPLPTRIISQQFPDARNATDIGAGARTGPIRVPPTPLPPTQQPGKPTPPHPQRPHGSSDLNRLLSRAKWAVGPLLILWGLLPVAASSWQLWQADFGLILLGAVVAAAQWLYDQRLRVVACQTCGSGAPVPATAKLFLIALTALISVAVFRPDFRAVTSDAISGRIEHAMNHDAAPAGQVAADPAQPEGDQ